MVELTREPVRAAARLTDVRTKPALSAAIAVVIVLLAGCGDAAEEPSDGGRHTAIPPTAEVTTPPPTPTMPTTPGLMELRGVPEPGVESGCWLLDDYLLLGGDEKLLSSGQPLVITGRVERGVMTTCQQGTAFRVDDVVPAE